MFFFFFVRGWHAVVAVVGRVVHQSEGRLGRRRGGVTQLS